MKDYKLLFVLGLIVLFFPFLGIPEFFRNLVVAIVGVFLVGYAIYIRSIIKASEIKKNDAVYVESEIPEVFTNEEVLEEGESFEEEFNKKENE